LTGQDHRSTLLGLLQGAALPLFTILTLFPEAAQGYLSAGLLGAARERGLVQVRLVDFRDFARDRHRTVDDRPFGGGPGMVLKPEPIVECIEWVEASWGTHRKLALCPAGTPFDQRMAEGLAGEERVLLLCGRYEGFDQRIFDLLPFESLSVGDFVLNGGELAALCVLEACVRLVPGTLGDERSAIEDSFHDGGGLDHPHYTRPRVWRGMEVPEVLLGGDHARIQAWRENEARKRTQERRPDLARGALRKAQAGEGARGHEPRAESAPDGKTE
jgi:tRNA (guanine37-N1)-methyltransferase